MIRLPTDATCFPQKYLNMTAAREIELDCLPRNPDAYKTAQVRINGNLENLDTYGREFDQPTSIVYLRSVDEVVCKYNLATGKFKSLEVDESAKDRIFAPGAEHC